MYVATFLLGTSAVALLVFAVFPPLRDDDLDFIVCEESQRGFVVAKGTKRACWWSHRHRGERHGIGEILRGLGRAERRQALAVIRLAQSARPLANYVPLSFYLKACSPRVQRRLCAPLRWAGNKSAFPSVHAWATSIKSWWG